MHTNTRHQSQLQNLSWTPLLFCTTPCFPYSAAGPKQCLKRRRWPRPSGNPWSVGRCHLRLESWHHFSQWHLHQHLFLSKTTKKGLRFSMKLAWRVSVDFFQDKYNIYVYICYMYPVAFFKARALSFPVAEASVASGTFARPPLRVLCFRVFWPLWSPGPRQS